MEQYKDKAIEHVETNKKTKMKIVTDRQRVVYKLIEDGHWTRKYFTGVFTEVVNKFRWKNQKFLNSHIFYTTCKLGMGRTWEKFSSLPAKKPQKFETATGKENF